MKPLALALPALVFLLVSGCAAPRDMVWPDPRPLGNAIPAYRPSSILVDGDSLDTEGPSPTSVRFLREALALALLHNPDLRMYAWEIRAREARALQAGLLPNPEIGTDVENFSGTGPLSGAGASELTLGLSQLIELGGDRRSRQRVAALERDLAGWDYETIRLDVLTETTQAFTGVLAAQARRILADSLQSQAQQFYESVTARVEAGKVSALEERRAKIVQSTTQIALDRAARELTVARARLIATWGNVTPLFTQVVGDLMVVEAVPPYEQVEVFIERNPDIARWRDEMALRRADVTLARAKGIPDPVLTIGTRRIRELGATALTASISIPLPFFDRNQGAIQEARYRHLQGEAAQEAATVLASRMLTEAYERLAIADTEVTMLREEVLPAAQENFKGTEDGYLEGKFDLLRVLDAQRTLFEWTNRHIDALVAYHTARAEVERLIGTPLSDI